MKTNIKKLNLEDKEIRLQYSKLLKSFENEFDYPLGDKKFFIKHGLNKDFDYFSFFEQMGEVHYFVAEENGVLIGAGCAILRKINNVKTWYLCDFKISKGKRGSNILEKIMLKYFISMYLKCRKMIIVNMSSPLNNGLINKICRLFKVFNLKIDELFFFEWNKKDIFKNNIDLNKFIIIHNKGKKDIVIENKPYDIYHLVEKDSNKDYSSFQTIQFDNIGRNDTIMWCSKYNDNVAELMKHKKPSTIGTILTYGITDNNFSSSEI